MRSWRPLRGAVLLAGGSLLAIGLTAVIIGAPFLLPDWLYQVVYGWRFPSVSRAGDGRGATRTRRGHVPVDRREGGWRLGHLLQATRARSVSNHLDRCPERVAVRGPRGPPDRRRRWLEVAAPEPRRETDAPTRFASREVRRELTEHPFDLRSEVLATSAFRMMKRFSSSRRRCVVSLARQCSQSFARSARPRPLHSAPDSASGGRADRSNNADATIAAAEESRCEMARPMPFAAPVTIAASPASFMRSPRGGPGPGAPGSGRPARRSRRPRRCRSRPRRPTGGARSPSP